MGTLITRVATLAGVVCAGLGLWALGAAAQAQDLKQIELNDKLVTAFITAQKDFAPLSSKLAEGGDKPDASLTTQLEDIAKKNGFADFAEFEDGRGR